VEGVLLKGILRGRVLRIAGILSIAWQVLRVLRIAGIFKGTLRGSVGAFEGREHTQNENTYRLCVCVCVYVCVCVHVCSWHEHPDG